MIDKEILQALLQNPRYRAALDLIKDEKERSTISNITEKFFMSIYGSVLEAQTEAQKDPDGFKKRLQEFEDTIVNVSGSAGL